MKRNHIGPGMNAPPANKTAHTAAHIHTIGDKHVIDTGQGGGHIRTSEVDTSTG